MYGVGVVGKVKFTRAPVQLFVTFILPVVILSTVYDEIENRADDVRRVSIIVLFGRKSRTICVNYLDRLRPSKICASEAFQR